MYFLGSHENNSYFHLNFQEIQMSSLVTVIIIDDERRSRELLFNLAQKFEDFKVIATAENVDHAFELIQINNPDLILLDIEMPAKNGFQLLEMLIEQKLNPSVIFTTAYDKYAIKAFRFAAFDYLLKPIKLADLELTLNRYLENRGTFNLSHHTTNLNSYFNNKEILKLDLRTGTLIIEPDELVLCTADGNYTHLFLNDGKQETVTFNIGEIHKMLPEKGFYRIDRSNILNLNYLKKIDYKRKSIDVKLNSEYKKIKVGKENIKKLQEIVQIKH